MATLLCHITIIPGKEQEFEAVIREMYRRTHAEEPGCIRYEYYRAAKPGKYYCLLSFIDRLAFLEHQVSEYHEGFDFAALIAALDMEWVDPVGQGAPLGPTEAGTLPGDVDDAISAAAETYPVLVQDWWQPYR